MWIDVLEWLLKNNSVLNSQCMERQEAARHSSFSIALSQCISKTENNEFVVLMCLSACYNT